MAKNEGYRAPSKGESKGFRIIRLIEAGAWIPKRRQSLGATAFDTDPSARNGFRECFRKSEKESGTNRP